MPSTTITLSSQREDGRNTVVSIEMNGDSLRAALMKPGPLIKLPIGDDEFVYINPAHVVMAWETSDDEGPMVAVIG